MAIKKASGFGVRQTEWKCRACGTALDRVTICDLCYDRLVARFSRPDGLDVPTLGDELIALGNLSDGKPFPGGLAEFQRLLAEGRDRLAKVARKIGKAIVIRDHGWGDDHADIGGFEIIDPTHPDSIGVPATYDHVLDLSPHIASGFHYTPDGELIPRFDRPATHDMTPHQIEAFDRFFPGVLDQQFGAETE